MCAVAPSPLKLTSARARTEVRLVRETVHAPDHFHDRPVRARGAFPSQAFVRTVRVRLRAARIAVLLRAQGGDRGRADLPGDPDRQSRDSAAAAGEVVG